MEMAMNADQLFVETMFDLDKRLASNVPYEVLGIAALVRKLIVDAPPLVSAINTKERQLKIRYEVGIVPDSGWNQQHFLADRLVYGFLLDKLLPEINNSAAPPIVLSKDGFLKLEVLKVRNTCYSILDIVRHCAHSAGAVHFDKEPVDANKALREINEFFIIDNIGGIFRLLKPIGYVVIEALRPLFDEVNKTQPR